MRRLTRPSLTKEIRNYLSRKQQEINQGKNVNFIWKYARKTKAMSGVVTALISMVGPCARCMFCHDSRGTTIEHFWPKTVYTRKTFEWKNLLLLCQGCQNQKGDRFELDASGLPLLINPTSDDPWDYLYYDSMTGNITAKFDAAGNENPKGRYTIEPKVLPLNVEAITLGRQRTQGNLIRAVKHFMERPMEGNDTGASHDLIMAIKENDDYGLAVWFFRKDGQDETPFQILRDNYQSVWQMIGDSIA